MRRENKQPPESFLRLLKWFCKPEYYIDIEGDLIELFYRRAESKGPEMAKWLLLKDVLLLFRPGIIRSSVGNYAPNHYGMFKNNLKVAFRNLIRRKQYTAINILGLAIGVSSSLLISLFVQNEFSYDRFFVDSDRIYKMVQEVKYPDHIELEAIVPYSFAHIMVQDYPEVESATAISGPYNGKLVSIKTENDETLSFLSQLEFLADSNFFSVFSFKMLKGDPKTALQKPNCIVLTESTAKRYFGKEDPLGKIISTPTRGYLVTGVCQDPPANSHFAFNSLVSSSTVAWFNQDSFNLGKAHCYFKLLPGLDAKALEAKLPELVKTYVSIAIERLSNISWEEHEKAGNGIRYLLKPLTSLYLDPANLGNMKPGGNLTSVRILIAVALLIFVIACINFMNLATARSAERAREVGVRKVMGSFRAQLVFQFLMESFILSFISLILAVALIGLALPYFNILAGTKLEMNVSPTSILVFVLLVVLVGLLAGVYPSFVLSAFKPIAALKGNLTMQFKRGWIRNGLVIFQFWISIVLIISTLVIQKQIDYMREKDLGFDKEQIMVMEGVFSRDANAGKTFLNEIKNLPQIAGVAGSLWVQGFQGVWSYGYRINGEVHSPTTIIVGDEFAEVLGFELLEGQFFSENTNDSLYVILNESAVRAMGLVSSVGKKIALAKSSNQEAAFTIKGVVKNFHFQTLHQDIEPLVIMSNEHNFGRMKYIIAKLNSGINAQTIKQIEAKWKELMPGLPFNFRFLDETLDAKYRNEQRTGLIFSLFSGLSIFIASIGLFALSSYTISMRTKEIGIRKVVGASTDAILMLVSGNFMKMILISFTMAIPVAWYIMDVWLQDFAFRTDITINVFILSGALALIITCLTVSIQSYKAAGVNPVKCLRDE